MFPLGAVRELPALREASIPDGTILSTVTASLPFMASFIPADLHLHKMLDEERAQTVGEGKPLSSPSFYRRSHVGVTFFLARNPVLMMARQTGQSVLGLQGDVVNGLPMHQMVYPVKNRQGDVLALLTVERNLHEEMRQGPKQPIYRMLAEEIVTRVLDASLSETRPLPSMQPGDALVVVEQGGIILYASSTAVNLARHVGIRDPLEGASFNELFEGGHWRVLEVNQLYAEQEFSFGKVTLLARMIPLTQHMVVVIRDVSELKAKDQQIEVQSAIIREIHHRVKNNLHAMVALLRLQLRRTDIGEVKDILRESINRVNSIALVHEYLSWQDVEQVDLGELAGHILKATIQSALPADLRVTTQVESESDLLFPSAQATSVALILNELLQNVAKHAFAGREGGHVTIRLRRDGDGVVLSVQDDGVGMPEGFDPEQSSNLGWRIILTLVKEDLHGQLEIQSSEAGTIVTITAPAIRLG